MITKLPDVEKIEYNEVMEKTVQEYKPEYYVERDFNGVHTEKEFLRENYFLYKNFTFVRNYKPKDLRFTVNYQDDLLVYKRKDVK